MFTTRAYVLLALLMMFSGVDYHPRPQLVNVAYALGNIGSK